MNYLCISLLRYQYQPPSTVGPHEANYSCCWFNSVYLILCSDVYYSKAFHLASHNSVLLSGSWYFRILLS